jgi:tripartite-type tricarboxylate transporter receptor subunit TctC
MRAGLTKGMCASVILTGCLVAMNALAQPAGYPAKLVRIIFPYPPGAGMDTVNRLISERLSASWNQPVIVESRPGADGNIGAALVARSDPDGYTLLSSAPGPIAINGSLFKNLAYDPAQWSAVTILHRYPLYLAGRKNLPVNTVPELVAMAKQNPGKFTFAFQGNGSIAHLTTEMFLHQAGVRFLGVPYGGGARVNASLMGDQVDVAFLNPSNVISLFRAGNLKVLAGSGNERYPVLHDVPTFSEAGFPNLQPYGWQAVVAPPNTPAPIAQYVSNAMAGVLKQPDVKKRLEDLQFYPVGGTAAETAAFLTKERARYREVIQAAKIELQ